MRTKLIIATAITVLGLSVLTASFYYKHRLNEAKTGVETLLTPLHGNPFGSAIGSDAKNSLKAYATKIHLMMAGGALITACGFSYFVYIRQKKD
jgi:hypothetical protein